jgi:uncharacterized protein YutE (UPF0331/DUF86 family)
MADDIIMNKAEIIENCIRRIHEEYCGNSDNLRHNQTKQDAILLNIERACQAAIDMAMRMVRLRKLGLPKESREAFDLLVATGLIDAELCHRMHGLVGFRNTAIHNYKKLDLDIVEAVIKNHLSDFQALSSICLKA